MMILLIGPSKVYSINAPITTAASVAACPGTLITSPITVTGFTNITAISLKIDYNPTIMTYSTFANLNPVITGISVSDLVTSTTLHSIMIVWSDLTARTIASGGTFLELKFNYISGSTTLAFDNTSNGGGNCEYADINGDPMNDIPTATYYINGSISGNPLPSAAGAITGSATVSQGQPGVAYSVPAIANATGYTWSLPTGATIASGSNTNSITVNFSASAVSGNITVYGSNTCGNGTVSAAFPVTVTPLVTNAPITTAGTVSVCPAAQATVPLNVTNFTNIGAFSLKLEYDYSKMTYASYANRNAAIPGAVITDNTVSSSLHYVLITWSGTAAAITNGGKLIDLVFNFISGTSSLSFNNTSNGGADCQYTNGYSIVLTDTPTADFYTNGQVSSSAPAAAGTITGLATVVQGTNGVPYSVPVIANATGYVWTLPTGGTIASGANTNSITVNFSSNAVSGNICVYGTNTCGSGTSSCKAITVNTPQNAPITTAGSLSACAGTAFTIPVTVTAFTSITAMSLRLNYNPTLMTFVNATNLNSTLTGLVVNNISVDGTHSKIMFVWSDVNPKTLTDGSKLADLNFTLVSGSPTLSFDNTSNGGSDCEYADATGNALNDLPTATYYHDAAVTLNPLPGAAGTITGTATVTQGQSGIAYSVPAITNATGYTWSLPTGASIATGANTNSITVNYSVSATSGNITVQGTNTCGSGTVSAAFAVTVNPLPTTAPITTAGTLAACPAATVAIPLTTVNFNNIASFSLRLEYDPTKMTYSSFSNLASVLTGASIVNSVVSGSVNKIMITFTNATGVTIASGGKIVDLNFTYIGGTSALAFNNTSGGGADCQYTNGFGIVLTDTPTASYYFDSQVTSSAPGTPGTITGLTVVPQGTSGVAYSVPAVTNATGYAWTLPPNATIASGANTRSITVDFAPNSTSGTITVAGTNTCGTGPVSAPLSVTVNPVQNAPITTVGGATPCVGTQITLPVTVVDFDQITAISLRIDYNPQVMTWVGSLNLNPTLTGLIVTNNSIDATHSKVMFVWSDVAPKTLTAGSKIADLRFNFISGNTTLAFNNTANGGSDCEYGDLNGNPLNDLPSAMYYINGAITGLNLPGAGGTITGPATVCQGSTGNVYSVSAISSATGYSWSLPTGASITAGDNTNSITVSYSLSAVAGNISVYGTNNCGNGTASPALAITVNPKPSNPGVIVGNADVCQGTTGVTYTIPAIGNATSYSWTVPTGATIMSGRTSNSITVDFAPTAVSGNITVVGINDCGSSLVPSTLLVSLHPVPAQAGIISGPGTVCQGSTGNVYSVAPVTDATAYTWTLPTGATITAGSNTNSITVSFSAIATAGNMSVYGHSDYCQGASSPNKAISLNPLPSNAGAITGITTVTQGTPGITYSVPSITNATGYNWVVPSGVNIVSGANTNTIVVDFTLLAAAGNITVSGTNDCGPGQESSLYVNVIQLGYTISGTFKYNNTAETPLDSVWVYLKQNGSTIKTARTDLTGSYAFYNVFTGTYTVSAVTSKPWNGVNALDATKVSRHVAGLEILPIGVRQDAADVNLSYTINALDATKIKRRVANLDNSFARGDWWFDKVTVGGDTVIVGTTNVTYNFYGLAVGDVNGSYNPSTGAKSAEGLNLRYDQTIKKGKNKEFNLSLRIDRPVSFTAITAVLHFPENLIRVKSASVKQGDLVYNVLPGEVRLVWAEVQPMSLEANESIVNLVVETTDQVANGDLIRFTMGDETEFGDENAKVISGFDLLMADVSVDNSNSVENLASNNYNLSLFPNPAKDYMNISFEIPAEVEVNCEVVSVIGEKMIQHSWGSLSKGKQLTQLDLKNLPSGVYFLNMIFDDKGEAKRIVQKIVINK